MSFTNNNFTLDIFSSRLYFLLFVLIFYSCSPTIILLDNKPDLVDSGYEFYVNRNVKKANSNPNNPNILINACKSLTLHSFGFTMEKADRMVMTDYNNSMELYAKANSSFSEAVNYGNQSLSIKFTNYKDWISGVSDQKPIFKKDDIFFLYWTAGAYGGAIKSSKGDPNWIIQLPKIGKLLEAAIEIDPNWNRGSLLGAMISYTMIRHDAPKDKELVAKEFFKNALKASNNLDIGLYVSMAESVCIPNQDRNEFTNLLYKAINIDINADPDLRLANIINKKRAEWLLDNIDEFFY